MENNFKMESKYLKRVRKTFLYNDNVEGLQIVATKVADKPLTLNGFNDWENRFVLPIPN